MAKKDLLATIDEAVAVGGGATGVSKAADATGGTATLPNSKKQGDAMQKVEDPSNTAIEDTDSENNTKPTGDKAASNKASIATKPSAASSTVKEDVAAMLDGFELSEDFKVQASTLFEAAVASRIAEERTTLEEEFQAKETELQESFEAAKAELIEEVSAKVDDYLSYVVKEWLEENRVAVEQSLRTELTEDLIGNIKRVFEESHINLPEVEAQLNAVLDENITLTAALEESVKEDVFGDVAEGLAMTQVEKFRTLAEGVEFSDADTYAAKLQMVKEQYFGEKKAAPAQLIEEREMVDLTEEVAPTKTAGPVANYVSAISRTVKK
jgi:hypothetical protein